MCSHGSWECWVAVGFAVTGVLLIAVIAVMAWHIHSEIKAWGDE